MRVNSTCAHRVRPPSDSALQAGAVPWETRASCRRLIPYTNGISEIDNGSECGLRVLLEFQETLADSKSVARAWRCLGISAGQNLVPAAGTRPARANPRSFCERSSRVLTAEPLESERFDSCSAHQFQPIASKPLKFRRFRTGAHTASAATRL